MKKSVFLVRMVAVALATAPVVMPTPSAALSITLNVGASLDGGRPISCFEGERRLRLRGFYNVRSLDCRGQIFVYRASRDGRRYEIAVSRHNGRVVDVRRIRR
jgi:hypothetical protein